MIVARTHNQLILTPPNQPVSQPAEKKDIKSPEILLSDNPLSPGFSVFAFHNPPRLTEEEKKEKFKTQIAHVERLNRLRGVNATPITDIPTLYLGEPYYAK